MNIIKSDLITQDSKRYTLEDLTREKSIKEGMIHTAFWGKHPHRGDYELYLLTIAGIVLASDPSYAWEMPDEEFIVKKFVNIEITIIGEDAV